MCAGAVDQTEVKSYDVSNVRAPLHPLLSIHQHRFSLPAWAAGWVVLSICLFRISALAQEYSVQNWHAEDGLPDGEITAIQQTPDGYLWIGTPKGLARFDGTRFKVFKAGPGSALPDSRITWLLTSRKGLLWISTQDGNVTRMQEGRFENVRSPLHTASQPDQNRTPGSLLWERRTHIIESSETTGEEAVLDSRTHLIEDREGVIWWHVSDVAVMRLEGDRWTALTPTNGLPVGIRQLTVDHEGNVWVEANGSLHCYDHGGWDTRQKPVALGGPWPVLAAANEGGLWVAEPSGSWFLNGGQVRRLENNQWHGGPEPIPAIPLTSRSTITCVMEDRNSQIWYGTAAGGVYLSDAKGHWQRLRPRGAFSQGYISCLFEDAQRSIWVGTVGDGLYRLTPQPLTMLALPTPMDSVEINTLCTAHDGAVWVGTGGAGVTKLCGEGKFAKFGAEQGLTSPHVCAVLEDSRTNVWAGTSEGLFRLGCAGFGKVAGPPELSRWVKALFEDRAGRLWIGTVGGLLCFQDGRFSVYYLRPDRGYCDIRSLAEDAAGNLWIGTIGQGLFVRPQSQPADLHRVKEFPASDARSLFCGADGTLWVGSWGAGLFQGREGRFRMFSTEDGLPSDRIQSIACDSESRLWLSTDNGVIGIVPGVLANYERGRSPPLWCQHLSLAEGLANRGCSGSGQPVSARTADGRIWFPDYEGLAILEPRRVAAKSAAPPILVETVRAEGKALLPAVGGELQAPSSVRRFEFDFTAPDLASARSLRFRCKLEGMDQDWVEPGERAAYYSQLKPGRYTFRLMVGGSDGEWHDGGQGIQLVVVPRLWERRWVQALAGALVIGVLSGGIVWAQRRKLRLQVERLEMQQAVEKERRRIARDLHDELGARLTATALHGELAVREGRIPEHAKSEMSLITRRVRQLIGSVNEVVWTTDPENDSLPNLAAFLCDYVEEFLANTGISCRLEAAPDLPDLPLAALARRNLLLAVKEAINNSVRHANPRLLEMKIYVEGDRLMIELSDDGCGFDTEDHHAHGNGLPNIQTRMQLVNGCAEVRSTPGKGTVVKLSMLLSPNGVPKKSNQPTL
jgi:ligand-binding sensor domain-containing protein/signal transduction histidine kinase